jgi:hypothetical protein
VVINLESEYKNNGIYFTCQNWNIPEKVREKDGKVVPIDFPINTFIEVSNTTHNKYDIKTV